MASTAPRILPPRPTPRHYWVARGLEPVIEISDSELEGVVESSPSERPIAAQPPPLPTSTGTLPTAREASPVPDDTRSDTSPAIEVTGSEFESVANNSLAENATSEQAPPPNPTAAAEGPGENARVSPGRPLFSTMTSKRFYRAGIGIAATLCAAVTAAALVLARPAGHSPNARAEPSAKAVRTASGASGSRATQAGPRKKSAVRVKPAVHRSSGSQARPAASARSGAWAIKAKYKSPTPALASGKPGKAQSPRTPVKAAETRHAVQARKAKGNAKPPVSKTST
jgi:hypothetical protein